MHWNAELKNVICFACSLFKSLGDVDPLLLRHSGNAQTRYKPSSPLAELASLPNKKETTVHGDVASSSAVQLWIFHGMYGLFEADQICRGNLPFVMKHTACRARQQL